MTAEPVSIPLGDGERVSGLWQAPAGASACIVLGHGAGVGMAHRSMQSLAGGLAAHGIASLRYQFRYMERGEGRVDPATVAHAVVRAAVLAARERAGSMPLFAGGRSFGGRMTSQAQAIQPLEGVLGLVFFAFPLHPAGRPSIDRAAHLDKVTVPMLFLQGTNDALAELGLLRQVIDRLGPRAKLMLAEAADHSFHVPAKSGRTDAQVLAELLDAAAAWMAEVGASGPTSTR